MARSKELEKDTATVEEPVAVVSQPKAEPVQESVYSAQELADNHKAFGTYREIVVVALRQAKMEKATFSEAKKVIDRFKNKEVK